MTGMPDTMRWRRTSGAGSSPSSPDGYTWKSRERAELLLILYSRGRKGPSPEPRIASSHAEIVTGAKTPTETGPEALPTMPGHRPGVRDPFGLGTRSPLRALE